MDDKEKIISIEISQPAGGNGVNYNGAIIALTNKGRVLTKLMTSTGSWDDDTPHHLLD